MFDTKHFPGAKKYWHMGEIYDWDTTQVHVMSHVVHYGSSAFEGIRAYETERGPAIFRLDDHIERLFHSAKSINMAVPFTKAEIMEACKLILRENRLRSAYVRPNLFFGYGNLGLTPKACPVELTIGCWEWGAYLGTEGLQRGVHVLLLPWKRIHPSQIDASVKLGGLYVQSNIFATCARKLGFDEAVFLNLEDRISEGPGENIVIVKNGVVTTNDKSESVLEGITRTTILKLAEDLGYRTDIAPITVEDFLHAEEAFFTGTAAEITPITRVTDSRDKSVPKEDWETYLISGGKPGRITLQLAQLYGEVVRGRHLEYDHWLTYVYDSVEEAEAALNGELTKERVGISQY
ncbi:MAG: branched-chain amino acid transaminase [Calditrichaceae bacterium]|nr:branched-chain amino acid transaminase [Calditrichia bacterium]NUQ41522.1 branched-chain amino acid transaminase [Calditrichaceae bacterium]